MRDRVSIEVRWSPAMADEVACASRRPIAGHEEMAEPASPTIRHEDAVTSKEHREATTNHDVKAVEYFVRRTHRNRQRYTQPRGLPFPISRARPRTSIILAYALMLRTARDEYADSQDERNWLLACELWPTTMPKTAMISRTHGQAAKPNYGRQGSSPTRCIELNRTPGALHLSGRSRKLGKFNGAVGNFNAHVAAYPGMSTGRPD